MNTLDDLLDSWEDLPKRLLNNVQTALYVQAQDVVKDLMDRSPVDTGAFKNNWLLSRTNDPEPGVFYSVSIQNNLPYAKALDEGVDPSGTPWYWPNPKNPGPVSKSGKLTIQNGRVWAGGKSPFGFVVGGISQKVLIENDTRLSVIANSMADAVVSSL